MFFFNVNIFVRNRVGFLIYKRNAQQSDRTVRIFFNFWRFYLFIYFFFYEYFYRGRDTTLYAADNVDESGRCLRKAGPMTFWTFSREKKKTFFTIRVFIIFYTV